MCAVALMLAILATPAFLRLLLAADIQPADTTAARCNASASGLTVSCIAQAVMIVADGKHSLQITGNGDVLEPHDGIIGELMLACLATAASAEFAYDIHVIIFIGAAIGSGGAYAGAASRALREIDGMDAQTIGELASCVKLY